MSEPHRGGIAQLVAGSPARLVQWLVGSGVAWAAVSVFATGHVREASTSPGMDVFVITGWMLLTFLTAVIAALLVGTLIFGDAWRRVNILGEGLDLDPDDLSMARHASKRQTLPIAVMVVVAIFALTKVMSLITDDFFDWYSKFGYATSTLRGDDEEAKLRVLVELTRSQDSRLMDNTDMIRAVWADPDASEALKTRAIFSLGEIGRRMVRSIQLMEEGNKGAKWVRTLHSELIQHVEPKLLAALEEKPTGERARALVFALGSLESDAAVPLMAQYLKDPARERETVRAIILALSQYRTPARTVSAILPVLAGDDIELAGLAAWAVGEMYGLGAGEATEAAPDPALVQLVAQRLLAAPLEVQCVLLDAMLRIRSEQHDKVLFALWDKVPPRTRCPRQELERPFQSPTAISKEEEVREKIVKALAGIAEGNPPVMAWLRRTAKDEQVASGLRADMNYILDVLAQRKTQL